MSDNSKIANSLILETSPYLLQHAYNPVQWLPFTEKAFEKAKTENKPMLISIGYSACHWCHVMEHESFEDTEVAEIMNRYFVNVKVDREERTDVDMLYMQAVQLMTGRGGWPLNCFVLPDGRPFYGGTYFNKSQWLNVLKNLADIHRENPDKILLYADELTNGIIQAELITTQKKKVTQVDQDILDKSVAKWKQNFDDTNGGPNRAPKFPLPSNYQFLLRYALLKNDAKVQEHVYLTLNQMASAGIYDQLNGGFARYSTDMIWKVPHFEKMLYDNAQLVSLYTEAYTQSNNRLYKNVVMETLDFVESEWLAKEGNFYSAFDADSDGEEGKYYVWTEADLKALLNDQYDIFSQYYEINSKGYWEHDNFILMRSNQTGSILMKYKMNLDELESFIEACKAKLKQELKSRLKPGLDDKSICSWNAMMCSAYAKAYLVFGKEKHKLIAIRSAEFILKYMVQPNGHLYRTYKNGQSKIEGFLEDYAFVIEALMNVYLISADEFYLKKALQLSELALVLFHNPESPFLFYTAKGGDELVTRITEISDNVIPASNSQMALNLFAISKYFDRPKWAQRAIEMLNFVGDELLNYGSGYSNWACLALAINHSNRELAIVGKDVDEILKAMYKLGITNAIFAVSEGSSEIPLLKNRFVEDRTLIYVCENNTCLLPVETIEDALKQIETA